MGDLDAEKGGEIRGLRFGFVGTINFEKPAKTNHRQQWTEFKNETLGMIEAAKRERHFHLLPKLMQRLQNANTILATIN